MDPAALVAGSRPRRRHRHPDPRPAGIRRVGLVGEPTADFVAAVHATWLAGRSLSILPGPVRGADPQQWARATLTRFTGLGVRTIFSHGDELALLSGQRRGADGA